jgi:site-specific DNA-methyltransferase (adenine-specific)
MQDMTKLMPSKTGKTTGWWYNKAKYKSQGLTIEQFNLIKTALNLPFDDLEETKREVLGKLKTNLGVMQNIGGDYTPGEIEVTKGNSEWEGWGTALKPAHEPIVMARKPLSEKTVVDNVLEWGTGGINIDESRIRIDLENEDRARGKNTIQKTSGIGFTGNKKDSQETPLYNLEQGRFPANLIFDEEAGKILDEQSGISKSQGGNKPVGGNYKLSENRTQQPYFNFGDVGGASRFFYCPKTSKTDRNEGLDDFEDKEAPRRDDGQPYGMNTNKFRPDGSERKPVQPKKNNHPTVKPTDLMLYLIRLVTPKGGTTLDPFMGSGSTGKAAVRGGFDFVGIEREDEYMEIAQARIQYEQDNPYNEEKGERVEINKNHEKFW